MEFSKFTVISNVVIIVCIIYLIIGFISLDDDIDMIDECIEGRDEIADHLINMTKDLQSDLDWIKENCCRPDLVLKDLDTEPGETADIWDKVHWLSFQLVIIKENIIIIQNECCVGPEDPGPVPHNGPGEPGVPLYVLINDSFDRIVELKSIIEIIKDNCCPN